MKQLAKRGERVRLPRGYFYDSATKTMTASLDHTEKVTALLAVAAGKGLLPAEKVTAEGGTLIVIVKVI